MSILTGNGSTEPPDHTICAICRTPLTITARPGDKYVFCSNHSSQEVRLHMEGMDKDK